MKPEIKLFFDFEFTSLSPDAQIISLGAISDCGKSIYAEFSDFDLNRCDDWVKENVVKKLRFNNEAWGKNAFEESHTEMGSYHGSGPLSSVKRMLFEWISQFSEYNIQFVCDCGTFDWYWMLQLLAEWDEIELTKPECPSCGYYGRNGHTSKPCSDHCCKIGLPILPANISPVPQDLNDLIALKKGISAREAFDLNREELAYLKIDLKGEDQCFGERVSGSLEIKRIKDEKHSALFDAKVIKAIYEKLS